jgi:hypothetical protein
MRSDARTKRVTVPMLFRHLAEQRYQHDTPRGGPNNG